MGGPDVTTKVIKLIKGGKMTQRLTSYLSKSRTARRGFLPLLGLMACPQLASAQDAALSSGDTAWILTATALVLFMSLPGLALFYGGLVRAKNYLSVLMKVYALSLIHI